MLHILAKTKPIQIFTLNYKVYTVHVKMEPMYLIFLFEPEKAKELEDFQVTLKISDTRGNKMTLVSETIVEDTMYFPNNGIISKEVYANIYKSHENGEVIYIEV